MSEKGRNESAAIVSTWIPIREPTSRPPNRCTSSTEKRGQRRFCALPPSPSPTHTTMLRTTYAATPEARAAYQIAGFELTCMPPPPPARASRSRSRRRLRPGRRSGQGRRARRATPGPCSPSRKAAFAATSAARQLAPEAVTWLQGDSLGRPVRGSIRCRPRDTTPLVARPPSTTRTASPPGSPTSTGPRTARSPPTETKPGPASTPAASSTASALTTPFRSSFTSGGRESSRPPRRTSVHRPTSVGSRSPSVSAAASSATATAVAKSGDTVSTRAGERFTRESSDSGRKRLKAASQRSSTAATAAGSPPPTTTSHPMARSRCTLGSVMTWS